VKSAAAELNDSQVSDNPTAKAKPCIPITEGNQPNEQVMGKAFLEGRGDWTLPKKRNSVQTVTSHPLKHIIAILRPHFFWEFKSVMESSGKKKKLIMKD